MSCLHKMKSENMKGAVCFQCRTQPFCRTSQSVPSAQDTRSLLLTPARSTGLRLDVTFVRDPPNLHVMPGYVLLTAPSVCLLQDVSLLTATAALMGRPLLHPLHPGGQVCVSQMLLAYCLVHSWYSKNISYLKRYVVIVHKET